MDNKHIYLYTCLYNNFTKEVIDTYIKSFIDKIKGVEGINVLGESKLESDTSNSEKVTISLSLVLKSNNDIEKIKDIISGIIKDNNDVFTLFYGIKEIKEV